MEEDRRAQVAYNLDIIANISSSITEVLGARTATNSVAGSYAAQRTQADEQRLKRIEDALFALNSKIAEPVTPSKQDVIEVREHYSKFRSVILDWIR